MSPGLCDAGSSTFGVCVGGVTLAPGRSQSGFCRAHVCATLDPCGCAPLKKATLVGPPARCNEQDMFMPTTQSQCHAAASLMGRGTWDCTGREGAHGQTGSMCAVDARRGYTRVRWNGYGQLNSNWGFNCDFNMDEGIQMISRGRVVRSVTDLVDSEFVTVVQARGVDVPPNVCEIFATINTGDFGAIVDSSSSPRRRLPVQHPSCRSSASRVSRSQRRLGHSENGPVLLRNASDFVQDAASDAFSVAASRIATHYDPSRACFRWL